MRSGKYRFFVLKLIMFAMLAAILVRLFNLQIIDGETYQKSASSRLTTNIVNNAARGDILDRYGNVLVTNTTGYTVVLQMNVGAGDGSVNEDIKKVVQILYTTGNKAIDTLPITYETPYEFMFEDENNDGSTDDEMRVWFANNKYNGTYIGYGMSAAEVLEAYCNIYNIKDNLYNTDTRCMAGVRYEADLKNFSTVNPVAIAENVSVDAVTRIKEIQGELSGISITEEYVRTYTNPGFATHILGRVGKISGEEYEQNKTKGYGINDVIGKQGIEKWAESYLKGVDGKNGATTYIDGKEIELSEEVDPVPGNYVMLTLDSELQQTLENSLENTIKSIGKDCNAGAAVVLDVNTGDTLAMASYPSYDMSRFNEDYSALLADESNPMINRAVCGLYSPGSTFKPLTAIAGLQSGEISSADNIECTGIYRFYEDYQPSCWIWSEYKLTHGHQNVTQAIENSCNVYFYELGRRLGIDKIDEYAKKFGLGEYTGVELNEEAAGHMASPEYKAEVISNVIDREWFGGDTLQAAIGQSYSIFTPVQLANYCATIANGGTRYKVNLISSIRSSVDGSLVERFEPKVVEQVDIDSKAMQKIHDGMKKVVDEGSARSIFEGYPIEVGGKTGTAQLGTGTNNAIFIAFAPFEKPEIAIAVVLEHGERGTNAGRVARDVFDKYFFNVSTQSASAGEEQPKE